MNPIMGLEIFLVIVLVVALAISLFANGHPVILARSILFLSTTLLTIISILDGRSLLAGLWGFNAGMDLMQLVTVVEEKVKTKSLI